MSAEVPRIKVCGLTSLEDAQVALAAGAGGLGFVHFPASPRHVELHFLDRLANELNPEAHIARVLVLVDAAPSEAERLCRRGALTHVQLAGRAAPEAWTDFPYPILRSVPVNPDAKRELEAWSAVAAAFVLDHPSTHGGSGMEVDSVQAAALARNACVLLAGGLGPTNVARLAREVAPFGVDASSRLELAPGRKDAAAVRAFVTEAQQSLPPLST